MHRPTRRTAIRASALMLVGAALGRPGFAVAETLDTPHTDDGAPTLSPTASRREGHGGHKHPEAFDEMYMGRHIQGWPSPDHPGTHQGHPGHDSPEAMAFTVRIDNDELHVMQNKDGTWISVINHYEKQDTPLAVARAAVRDLHGASLVPLMV